MGGHDFEQQAYDACVRLTETLPVSVTHTGNTTGSMPRCKTGDVVIEFDSDHKQAGGSVVIEAKREAKWI